MDWTHLLAIVVGVVATVVPVVTAAIPPPFNAIAVAVVALGTSLWHLYTPVPGK